jgi:hypothetical protein
MSVTRGEPSSLDVNEMIERLNAGRRRVREDRERRQALNAGTQTEA